MTNSVYLLDYMGGDKRACLSAWQSTTEELGIKLPENIKDRVDVIFPYLATQKKKSPSELLEFLAQHNHETPFEKCILDFQITGDLRSHIHTLKHRISSVNAESARYKEFQSDRFYIPDDWGDCFVSKSTFLEYPHMNVELIEGESWGDVLASNAQIGFDLYHLAITDITKVLGRKRAKESAAYFLNTNLQLNYDWMMNFRSFVNIQRLRNSPHAQREIHQIANTMLYLVENIPGNPFQLCLNAFGLKSAPEYVLNWQQF